MSLTVPKAGLTAGRAARAGHAVPNAGAEFAQLGDNLAAAATAIENDRLSREAQRLQVDLTKDMNDLRLEFEQIGDPDQIEEQWGQRIAALRNEYFTGANDEGRLRVDPKNHERFGLAFDDLSQRHGFAMAQRAMAGRFSQREATWVEYQHEAINAGANADPETRDGLLASGDAMIDELVANNVIDAATAAKRKLALRGDMSNASAISLVNADPQAYLELADAGEFDDLGGEAKARYAVQAQNALDRQATAAMTAEEKATRAREKEIDGQLDDIIAIAGEGRTSVDEAWLNSPEVLGRPKHAEAMAAISLREEQPGFDQMTVADLDGLITTERGKKLSEPFQAERLKVLQETRAARADAWQKDAVGTGRAQGIPTPNLPEYDPNNPADFAAGLEARLTHAQWMVEKGYTDQVQLFDADDLEAIKPHLALDADPKDRANLATILTNTMGEDAPKMAARMGADAAFVYSTNLTAQGAPAATVSDIMAGSQKLAAKTVQIPTHNKFVAEFGKQTEGMFLEQPELAPQILASAKALYAQSGASDDPAEIDTEVFATALQRALGGEADANGQLTVGGLQTFDVRGTWGGSGDDYAIPLPVGVPAAGVNGALDQIEADLSKRWVRDHAGTTGPDTGSYSSPSMDRLAAASITGAAPNFGDPEADDFDPAETFSNMRLGAYWQGGKPSDTYVFYAERGGRKVFLYDTEGKVFRISLKQLLQGASQ